MRGASSSGVGIKVLERNETQTNGNVPSTETQENKAVSSQELREQVLDSFIQVLSATGKDDQLIQKIIPKINKVFKAQEKFIKKDLAEKRIIRKELGEGVNESFKGQLKTLEKKSETLAVQGGMISKVKALIKVSLEQKKIDELKEDLESKLNLLNVREEELADGASKQFFDNYLRGKEYYPDLLKAFPSVIRSVENAITPDNKEKMEKRIKSLNKLGEDIIKEELKKLENDYQGGEKNHPAILKKLPDIIEFLIVIRTSDKKHIVENKKLIKSLDGKYKEMLAKRGKIRRPENSLQESDDVESASLSPIMDELEEQVKGGGEKLLDRHGKPMKGDGDEVAKQYAPKGLSPQSRSALGSGLVITKEKSNLTDNKSVVVNKLVKMQAMQNELTENMKKFNNRTGAKKNTSRSLLLEFGTEGSDKKIGEDEIGKDERDREERLKMLLTKHDDEKFKKEEPTKYLYLLKQLPKYIHEVINDTANRILPENEEHNTDKKSSPDINFTMKNRIKFLKELDQDIKLELLMMDRSIRMESKKEGNNKNGSGDELERKAKFPKIEVTQQKSGSRNELEVKLGSSPLITNEAPKIIHHEELMVRQKERQNQLEELMREQVELMKGGGDQVVKQNTSRSLSPEFQKEGSNNKIDESERDREFQKDVKNLENNKLALQQIYNNLSNKKFTECDLEKLDKTIKQIHIYNDIFIEQILNKYAIDTQAVRSPEAETISPQQIVNKYPPAPTLPPKSGNPYKSPPKDSQTAIPSVYSPKVNSVYSPKANSANSPKANSSKVNPVYSPQPILLSTFPIVARFTSSPRQHQQQTRVSSSVAYYANPSNRYSHDTRGPDVYSQVPRGSVQFIQQPPRTTIIPNMTSPRMPFPHPNNSRFN